MLIRMATAYTQIRYSPAVLCLGTSICLLAAGYKFRILSLWIRLGWQLLDTFETRYSTTAATDT